MTVERYVRLFAGSVVLLSLALGTPASPLFLGAGWLWVGAFVGLNLAQSSLTGICPLASILRALGVRSSPAAG